MTTTDALRRLGEYERTPLASLPTPLLATPNLAAAVGRDACDLFVKMDAETGFALGGNKVRKLEFELAPSRIAGVTHLITAGGTQSNHARVTAAAAARLGMTCTLVLNGEPADLPRGNALLHRLFGAAVHHVSDRAQRDSAMEEIASRVEGAGGRALVVPVGASTGLGCLGYARAAVELADQLAGGTGAADRATWIFVSSSSCGTLAGLALGFSLLGRGDVRLVGVSADASEQEILESTTRLGAEGRTLLGSAGSSPPGLVRATDAFVGAGYGAPTSASQTATELFARSEGIVLDPVYTSKAAAGMLAWLREGAVPSGDRVVFLHTGGHPALLA